MKVIIFGKKDKIENLLNIVNSSLEDLGLNDFVNVEENHDSNFKKEMNITKEPALIIEEESIDFKDVIFEGQIPAEDEIKSMFVSIIGGDMGDSCAPSSCSSCGSASVCGI